jgi:hypothetical protein
MPVKEAEKKRMSHESSPVEQAVARALRDNLEKLQKNADGLHQAINDIVAACASTKPTNALPPMLRAQTAAAALAASLEVLTRFVTAALQPAQRTPLEAEIARIASLPVAEPSPARQPPLPSIPTAMGTAAEPAGVAEDGADSLVYPPPEPPAGVEFDVALLPPAEQELHRRANRIAKVSMQDIKMLKPEQVRQGREHRDICTRLRDEIEKAHREYLRRFKTIQDHPVDYFYHWMVEILADGDPQALGEYPYASPVRQ